MSIHFCTEQASATHVLPVLLDSDDVIAVDNWQGPDIFIGEDCPVKTQSIIAIIGDIDLENPGYMQKFINYEPVRQVPRNGGRGLFMTSPAGSVEQVQRLYFEWQKYF